MCSWDLHRVYSLEGRCTLKHVILNFIYSLLLYRLKGHCVNLISMLYRQMPLNI